jgi:F0F1-type ATP synthase assembly protein I
MDSNSKKPLRDALHQAMREIAPLFNLGTQMAVSIVIFTFIGWWLDSMFNISPVLIIIFSIIGVFAAFYYFFKAIKNK